MSKIHNAHDCELCSGSGEVTITYWTEQDGDKREVVGCPLCIQTERDTNIATLKQRIAELEHAEQAGKVPTWADAERISNVPAVEDALRAFSQDSNGCNAIAVVLAIMEASSLTDRIEGETQNAPGSLRFFAYDSEVGFERFNTEAEAKKFVQEFIDEYRAIAGDGWPEEVENLCWGVVLGTTKQVPVPDDGYDGSQGVADSGPFVDYVLTNYTQHAPVQEGGAA